MLPEIIVDKPQNLPEILARRFEDEARRALSGRPFFSVALTGGSVATAFYPRLVAAAVDWSRTEVFWGDERAVAPSDPESNYGLAARLLLTPAGVPGERIHRMPADQPDLAAAADAAAEELTRILGSPPRLDLALLGVGPDGHVCSLFPRHPLLKEEQRAVAAVTDSPKPPPRRLTVTLPVLRAAELVVIVTLGEAKAAVIHEALEDTESQLPVALAARGARRAVFLLDDGAARDLKDRRSALPG
jgi:6-phosphogluconolactonase